MPPSRRRQVGHGSREKGPFGSRKRDHLMHNTPPPITGQSATPLVPLLLYWPISPDRFSLVLYIVKGLVIGGMLNPDLSRSSLLH